MPVIDPRPYEPNSLNSYRRYTCIWSVSTTSSGLCGAASFRDGRLGRCRLPIRLVDDPSHHRLMYPVQEHAALFPRVPVAIAVDEMALLPCPTKRHYE